MNKLRASKLKKLICAGIALCGMSLALTQLAFGQGADIAEQDGATEEQGSQELLEFADMSALFVIPTDYFVARVEKVTDRGETQDVILVIGGGPEKGQTISIIHGEMIEITDYQKVTQGEEVIVGRGEMDGAPVYTIMDKYRIPAVAWIAAIFFAVAIFFGKKKGFTSVLGMILTILILVKFIIPPIVAGGDPFWISLFGAIAIAFISLYLSHGFNRRTTIALIGTLITLGLSAILSLIFVNFSKLSGAGTEDAYFLQLGSFGAINLQGLLLGGIVIGALGILDDITTGQAAAVEEIHKANPRLSMSDLYKRGLSVGREHIASLINTLVLAYAGASFPLFIIFSVDSSEPLWVTLNHEYLVEEIIRTFVGSTTLIFAVPITTWLAARAFTKPKQRRHA